MILPLWIDKLLPSGLEERRDNDERRWRSMASAGTKTIDVILLAAGAGRRMGGIKKQFAIIGDKPVFRHAIEQFRAHQLVRHIVLVIPDSLSEADQYHLQDLESAIITVTGGAERHLSVQKGLAALAKLEKQSDYIAIHDAARPFVPASLITELMQALLAGHNAVIPVLAVADTIKSLNDTKTAIHTTLDRDQLVRVQTPQAFHAPLIHKLHQELDSEAEAILDDAYLAEQAGIEVHVITGDEALQKITWPEDLRQLQTSKGQMMSVEFRTGTGFDVHRFKQGDGPIMICGIAVPFDKALDAHSDGDVGIHALCDAIFGALCDGDIGAHFPPTDERWKDAASDQFLIYAVERLKKVSARLTHIDVTILCERPKIGPYRDEMRGRLAELTGLPLRAVSVKATTTERLGFTGREEGIAAQAAATICFENEA